MSFEKLSASLLERARDLVRNGEYTERSLARLLGISQPHSHNVLKGVRALTPELFDTMLKQLGIEVLDLYQKPEIDRHLAQRATNSRLRRPA